MKLREKREIEGNLEKRGKLRKIWKKRGKLREIGEKLGEKERN